LGVGCAKKRSNKALQTYGLLRRTPLSAALGFIEEINMKRVDDTNWRVWGPLVFASLLFVIASAIKLIAFGKTSFILDIGSEFALWATGVLFSLAAANKVLLEGRTEQVFKKKSSGTGIENDYIALPPDELDFTPKYLYLFIYSMMSWILTLLISEQAHIIYGTAKAHSFASISLAFLALSLAATSVGIAIRALLEAA
jgi:hypothetical protein